MDPRVLIELDRACTRGGATEAGLEDIVDGVPAAYVCRPSSTDEVAAVVRTAAAERLPLVVRGAGTKLDWGNPPSALSLILDVSQMTDVLEHAAGDLVLRVEAGATLSDLQSRLVDWRQRVPIDEVVSGSTIGGVVATGVSGPTRYRHGAVRDLILGLTFVRSDGVVVRSGSKVVKNVAGYDLAKLMTGSYGTLGVITEITVKLRPTTAERRFVSAAMSDESAVASPLAAVLHSQAMVAAVELERHTTDGPIGLSVLLEGEPGPVDERASAIRRLLGRSDVDTVAPDGWGTLPSKITVKITSELAAISRLLGRVHALCARHNLDVAIRGSGGVGVLFVGLPPTVSALDIGALLPELRNACASCGGTTTLLRAPSPLKSSADVWGPISGLELMRRVKHEFDPANLLAPNRFVGGI